MIIIKVTIILTNSTLFAYAKILTKLLLKLKLNWRKILRRTLITLISIFVFVLLLIFSLRIPAVQNYVKDKLIVYLEGKIKTKVSLEKVYIAFPNSIPRTIFTFRRSKVGVDLSVGSGNKKSKFLLAIVVTINKNSKKIGWFHGTA